MLYSEFLKKDKLPIDKWEHYFPIYEKHFGRFVNQPIVFWEIGVQYGGSIQMWKKYFGPLATVVGIDIDPNCKCVENQFVNIRIGDQSDLHFLQDIINEFGAPDIVLDDGSHMMNDINTTFHFLYPRISKNGIYLVEDLHTAYWSEFDGGLKKEGTFIEICKGLIDSLNIRHARIPQDGNEKDFTFANSTYGISFYDSIVVFEKMQWKPHMLSSVQILTYLPTAK
ncbi:class I SAM-dependent methyltransferase [Lachnospiraceae bacterium ZAX-1]